MFRNILKYINKMASLKWIFGIYLRNTCQSHETLNFSLNLIYAEKN